MNIIDVLLGPTFGKIIDKIFPDPAVKQQAQLQILQLQQAGELKEMDDQLQRDLAQIGVDNTEAQSPNFWKAGARPAVMWVCVLGLFYDLITQPLLSWASTAFWHCPVPPQLDGSTLLTLLTGLLGLSVQRHLERQAGTA